jgi:hypothetical protein
VISGDLIESTTQIRDAIVTKYGPPASSLTKIYENKIGATIPSEVAIWQQPGSAMVIHEVLTEDVDRSALIIFDPATQQANAAKVKGKANKDF